MKMLALVVGVLLALSASAAAGQTQALEERGMAVYAEQKCRLCHSIDGEGNKKGPLDDVGSRLTVEELDLWMVDPKGMTERTGAPRKPFMREYPSLSEEDRAAVVAYMLSLKAE